MGFKTNTKTGSLALTELAACFCCFGRRHDLLHADSKPRPRRAANERSRQDLTFERLPRLYSASPFASVIDCPIVEGCTPHVFSLRLQDGTMKQSESLLRCGTLCSFQNIRIVIRNSFSKRYSLLSGIVLASVMSTKIMSDERTSQDGVSSQACARVVYYTALTSTVEILSPSPFR